MGAFCCDPCQALSLMVCCGASFADCVRTHKSRSEAYIALVGYNTSIPLAAICKTQAVASHSFTGAEVV